MKIENIFFHTTSNFLFVLRDFFDIDILKSRQSKITSSDSIGELGIYEDSFRVQKLGTKFGIKKITKGNKKIYPSYFSTD